MVHLFYYDHTAKIETEVVGAGIPYNDEKSGF